MQSKKLEGIIEETNDMIDDEYRIRSLYQDLEAMSWIDAHTLLSKQYYLSKKLTDKLKEAIDYTSK